MRLSDMTDTYDLTRALESVMRYDREGYTELESVMNRFERKAKGSTWTFIGVSYFVLWIVIAANLAAFQSMIVISLAICVGVFLRMCYHRIRYGVIRRLHNLILWDVAIGDVHDKEKERDV